MGEALVIAAPLRSRYRHEFAPAGAIATAAPMVSEPTTDDVRHGTGATLTMGDNGLFLEWSAHPCTACR